MKILRRTPTAVMPFRATEGAAAFDLSSDMVTLSSDLKEVLIDTGLSVIVPWGHVLLIFSRSGQGFKNGTRLSNCVGVIDSDYRGPLMVKLTADADVGKDYIANIRPGDRIAQMMLLELPNIRLEEIDQTLFDSYTTVRGEGGFGSTGK